MIDTEFEFLDKVYRGLLQSETDAEIFKWSIKETLKLIEMDKEQLRNYSQALDVALANIHQEEDPRHAQMMNCIGQEIKERIIYETKRSFKCDCQKKQWQIYAPQRKRGRMLG